MIKKKDHQGPIEIDLTGPDGNAFALMGYARKLCRQLKSVDPEKYDADKIINKMMESDYENLVTVFDEYFGDFVTLLR